jgi:hypothetical protein
MHSQKPNRSPMNTSTSGTPIQDPKAIIEGFLNAQGNQGPPAKQGQNDGDKSHSPKPRQINHPQSIQSPDVRRLELDNSRDILKSPDPLLKVIDKHQMIYRAPEELDRLSQTLTNIKNKGVEESSIQLRYGVISDFDSNVGKKVEPEMTTTRSKKTTPVSQQVNPKELNNTIHAKTVDKIIEKNEDSIATNVVPISLVRNGSLEISKMNRPVPGQARVAPTISSHQFSMNLVSQITSTGFSAMTRPPYVTSLTKPEQGPQIPEFKNHGSTKRSFEQQTGEAKIRDKSDEALTSRRDPIKLSHSDLLKTQARTFNNTSQVPKEQSIRSEFPNLNRIPSQIDLPIPNFKKFSVSDFEMGVKLGKGRFGDVFLARERKTNYIVALKILNKAEIQRLNAERLIVREIKIHSFIDHPNIIKLYGFFHDDDNIYLILEFAPDGEVYKELKEAVS